MSLRNRQVAKSANILKDFKVSLAAVMILEIHKGLALQVYRSWIPTDSYGFLWLFMDRGSLAIPNFSVGNLEIWNRKQQDERTNFAQGIYTSAQKLQRRAGLQYRKQSFFVCLLRFDACFRVSTGKYWETIKSVEISHLSAARNHTWVFRNLCCATLHALEHAWIPSQPMRHGDTHKTHKFIGFPHQDWQWQHSAMSSVLDASFWPWSFSTLVWWHLAKAKTLGSPLVGHFWIIQSIPYILQKCLIY